MNLGLRDLAFLASTGASGVGEVDCEFESYWGPFITPGGVDVTFGGYNACIFPSGLNYTATLNSFHEGTTTRFHFELGTYQWDTQTYTYTTLMYVTPLAWCQGTVNATAKTILIAEDLTVDTYYELRVTPQNYNAMSTASGAAASSGLFYTTSCAQE